MRIGISLDAYLRSFDVTTAITKLHEIGFDAADINFSDYTCAGSVLESDDWIQFVVALQRAASECGLMFSQLHSPIVGSIDDYVRERSDGEMMRRSFEVCQILKVPWAVVHEMSQKNGLTRENYKETIIFNSERLKRLCNKAMDYGIGVALENVSRIPEDLRSQGIDQTSHLCAILDNCSCNNLGVCLDTGHAYCTGTNPSDAARKYGERLKVLHVSDNDGMSDQHVAPFIGRIDWSDFMRALREINYTGVFSLEIHNYVQRLPVNLVDDGVALSFKIAKHLLSI